MILEKDNAARCARMAKVRLSAQEEALYEDQMKELFDWVEQLSSVDTSSVEETAALRAAYLRPDQPITDESLAQTLVSQFNAQQEHCDKVQKVL